ncbi:MAG TPA: neutral zinc metallopeptidase [Devosia sp.]|jgi:predicted metalloprotease|nr:neutral zinc metallopeptidase [Devosia sp.]
MKWQGREQSSNIEDRRSQGGGGPGGGGFGGGFNPNSFGNGGGIRLPSGRSGSGLGGLAIIVIFVLIALAFGINPLTLLTGEDTSTTNSPFGNSQTLPPQSASQDDLSQFVGVVVKDTENFWGKYFSDHGGTYTDPKVVLFTDRTQSGCGVADRDSGPFYCPEDGKVYIDLSFYQQLRDQFGAPGDFAQAYVIAHEVGHHVQDLLGILPTFNERRQSMSQDQANAYSVKVELQADCFAGMWAKGEQQYLDNGDVEEAINAANQIGDDTLTHNTISPRQYTHGTSAQRMQWFKTGFGATDVSQCDTGIPR